MNLIDWLQGFVRHTGYATLLLGGGLSLLERFVPGFSTPYINTYVLTAVGLGLSVLGGWGVSSTRLVRLGIGICVIPFVLLLFFQGTISGVSITFLAGGVLLLLIAFLVESLYSEEV